MNNCPCGSNKKYEVCCKPYISGAAEAPTAEALMRARYSAYVMHEIDYIERTHSLEKRDSLSVEETRKWSEESEWLGLEIVSTEKGLEKDSTGTVEFIAKYKQNGVPQSHHEMSEFKKVNGKWFFSEGQMVSATVVRSQPKVGRNDPCPCGSGKKAKKCCYK